MASMISLVSVPQALLCQYNGHIDITEMNLPPLLAYHKQKSIQSRDWWYDAVLSYLGDNPGANQFQILQGIGKSGGHMARAVLDDLLEMKKIREAKKVTNKRWSLAYYLIK